MMSLTKAAVGGLAGICKTRAHQQGLLHGHLKVLTAGMKNYEVPTDYRGVVLPEKPKLTYMMKVPQVVKVRRERKNLRDIQGPTKVASSFSNGQFAIMAMGGGYLEFGHLETIRLAINRNMNTKTTFARWRVKAPYKPITQKSLGHRMGGGKGAINHYVTPVRAGRFIVEVGGKLELQEIERYLNSMAKKLPFPAIVVSRESLAALKQKQREREENNQNPWTFKRIAMGNMLGIRKVLSPRDLEYHGRYTGKFYDPDRV